VQTSEYKGKTYYFCAKGCKVAFDKDPEKYLRGESENPARQLPNRTEGGSFMQIEPPSLFCTRRGLLACVVCATTVVQ
jgi:hypothetical protein